MRSDSNGISLIELLIAVILISAVASAFLNFRDDLGLSSDKESELSAIDSALQAALEEIGLDLRMAQRNHNDKAAPLVIEHSGGTDRIVVSRDNVQNEYLVDRDSRLIRQTNNSRTILAYEVLSLKARELGKETIVLTITPCPAGEKDNGLHPAIHSYSKVVTVSFTSQ